MIKTTLAAPWDEYYKKVDAMFKHDPNVNVVYYPKEYKIKLFVENQAKAEALNHLLKPDVIFGNITMLIEVVPPNVILGNSYNPYVDAFKENSAVFKVVKNEGVFKATYIVCRNKVVQYFDDDISSHCGIRSTLYEDIAKEIFVDMPGVFFCTYSQGVS